MASEARVAGQPLSVAAGFVSALTDDERTELQRRARSRRFKSGAVVFHEGTASDGVIVIVRGRVKVSTVTAAGKEVLLAVRGPGDLLGELSAIDGLARSDRLWDRRVAMVTTQAFIRAGESDDALEKVGEARVGKFGAD